MQADGAYQRYANVHYRSAKKITRPGTDIALSLQRTSVEHLLHCFNQTNSDLHLLVEDNIVGGPAIIFHRYHEKDITKKRTSRRNV